jgi:hypothetical protein
MLVSLADERTMRTVHDLLPASPRATTLILID